MENMKENEYQNVELKSKRMVVKIGSSSIAKRGQPLNESVMDSIASQTSNLYRKGVEIALVSSGAVICGENALKEDSKDIFDSQEAAIYGQPILISKWVKCFEKYGVLAGQILFSEEDLPKPNTPIIRAMKRGIPIVNANDAINNHEMKQYYLSSDNDQLALHISRFVDADTLLLLTDVEGVFDQDGKIITLLDDNHLKILTFGDNSNEGTGGMKSKINVGLNAARDGKRVIISKASNTDVLIKAALGISTGTEVKL